MDTPDTPRFIRLSGSGPRPYWICLAFLGALLVTGLSPAHAKDGAGAAIGIVAGRVSDASEPLSAAKVYAYQLADLTLRKVSTDAEGNFFFRELPAGLYKVIAHKAGFVPTVVRLARTSAGVDQFLDLQLIPDPGRGRAGEVSGLDFWQIRRDIPKSVLRDLGLAPMEGEGQGEEPRVAQGGASPEGLPPLPALPSGRENPALESGRMTAPRMSGVQARMKATAGIDQVAGQDQQVTGGEVRLDTQLGGKRIGLEGNFVNREPEADGAPFSGRQSAVSLELANRGDSRLNLSTQQNTMVTPTAAGVTPVDFENYAVSWSGAVGRTGRSEFRARYTSETNFYRGGVFEPASVPADSRTLSLAGSYTGSIGEQGSFQTQLRYRERQGNYFIGDAPSPLSFLEETVELMGRGGWQVQPAVVVEYGLYTKLRDGSLSLTPRGGLVWQINPDWQAAAEVTHRVHDEGEALFQDFVPVFHHQAGGCNWAEDACYRVALSREGEDDGEQLSLGLMHRRFGETLRLYFDEDFFDQMESLVMVEGDVLPEVQMALSRRLSPNVLARVESNVASGGGGLFYALGQEPFENKVQYLVTSIDTQFQTTSTGVFLAFHHLTQELVPMGSSGTQEGTPLEMQTERLQLMLTQDLNFLTHLAAEWAVHLNMEVSRGNSAYGQIEGEEDELRKRILGGLAVRF
jgi:hypothetical protein